MSGCVMVTRKEMNVGASDKSKSVTTLPFYFLSLKNKESQLFPIRSIVLQIKNKDIYILFFEVCKGVN